jgi:hypothetical protein
LLVVATRAAWNEHEEWGLNAVGRFWRVTMTQKMPPVPPENRSPKGPGSDPAVSAESPIDKKNADRTRNLGEQGRQGNIKQNTTNQGYQQDR